jgi:hypothetical protein
MGSAAYLKAYPKRESGHGGIVARVEKKLFCSSPTSRLILGMTFLVKASEFYQEFPQAYA